MRTVSKSPQEYLDITYCAGRSFIHIFNLEEVFPGDWRRSKQECEKINAAGGGDPQGKLQLLRNRYYLARAHNQEEKV